MTFLKVFATTTPEEQDQLYEYYLHNYVVSEDAEWNPLIYVGDLQVRAMASYFRNEKLRGEIMQAYTKREKSIALPIRRESKIPESIIAEWRQLLEHKGVGRKIVNLRLQDYDKI